MQRTLPTLDDLHVDAKIKFRKHTLMMQSKGIRMNVCDLTMDHQLFTTYNCRANNKKHRPGMNGGDEKTDPSAEASSL